MILKCNINPHIQRYIDLVESGEIEACAEQHKLVAHVRQRFEEENINVDEAQLEKYLSYLKYFPYERLFEWEEFLLALHCCTYRSDGLPRWPDLFALMGRGAGKDGYVAFQSFCLTSKANGIQQYDIDICANNESQAMAPFEDIYNVLEHPNHRGTLKKFFYWNRECITNLQTKSRVKYRTNSPRGKDGLRSGAVIFNEIHQYEDYENINVFTTGLGKKKHPRRTYITTNGDVRDGPLDHMLADAQQILDGAVPDGGMLPFICRLDDKDEVNDQSKWEKANPSLRHLPNLQEEIRKEYRDYVKKPSQFTAFMTKRMNRPEGNKDLQVTEWENLVAASAPLPDLKGRTCVAGLDYAKTTDFVSAGLWFRDEEQRYWLHHTWVCRNSADWERIKFPILEAEKLGFLTVVSDIEIHPDIVVGWLADQAADYNITALAMDNFRYSLMSSYLAKLGFSSKRGEGLPIKLIRPSDQMKVVPVVERYFSNRLISWGEEKEGIHPMRWYVNNTKLVQSGVDKDRGNYTYGKIEPHTRKTDGFMAMVAAACLDEMLDEAPVSSLSALPPVAVFD